MDLAWNKLKDQSQSNGIDLWNRDCYRLENLDEVREGSKTLKLSLLQYSTVRSLIELNKAKPLKRSLYPLHINTGALIKTSDNQFVFGLKKTGKSSHSVDLVGGGLQPDELQVCYGQDIVNNLLKELEEETNLTSRSIHEIQTLGFILSHTSLSIIIAFEVKLTVTKKEVLEIFRQRADPELIDLITVKENELSFFLSQQSDHKKMIHQLRI